MLRRRKKNRMIVLPPEEEPVYTAPKPRTYFALVTPNGEPTPAPAPARGDIYLNNINMPVVPPMSPYSYPPQTSYPSYSPYPMIYRDMPNYFEHNREEVPVLGWEDFDDFDF